MITLRLYIFLYAAALGVFGIVGTLFLLENGHSFYEIGIYASVLGLTIIIAEIPTGLFADKYATRLSLGISSAIRMCVALIYLFYYNHFEAIFIASILAGLSEAFFSGAYQKEALLIGRRKNINTQHIFANLTFTRMIGTLIGGCIGYSVWHFSLFSVWYIPFILFCVSQFYFLSHSENNSQSDKNLQFKFTKKQFLKFCTRGYFWLFVFNGVAAIAPIMASQYILEKLPYGLLIGFLGYNIAGMVAARTAMFKKHKKYTLPAIIASNAVMIISLGFFETLGYWFIVFAIAHVLFHTYQTIAVTSIFQDQIGDEQRATLTSIASVCEAIIAIPIYLFVGFLMDNQLFLAAMSVSSITVCVIFIILISIYKTQVVGSNPVIEN